MSFDSVTRVTHDSWFSRLGKSVMGVLIGIALFLGSFVLLWWNEGRAVHTALALLELKGAVVSVPADRIDATNEGKPIHIADKAVTDAILADEPFGVTAPAIKLRRKVEMYQWKEDESSDTREKVGGGTETTTTYTYSKNWFKEHIVSSKFAEPRGHENPGAMRYVTTTMTADPVNIGAFTLSPGLVGQIDNFESLPVAKSLELSTEDKQGAVVKNETVYLPHSPTGSKPDPAEPQVGDLRISWEVARPAQVSLIARQFSSTFEPWQADSAKGMGTTIERLMLGVHSAKAMVSQMEAENSLLTWGLRFLGFAIMTSGLLSILSPLAVLASIIPFLGSLTRGAISIAAMLVSLSLSLTTIGLAWFAYRPIAGISLLILAGGVIGLVVWLLRKRAAVGRPAVQS